MSCLADSSHILCSAPYLASTSRLVFIHRQSRGRIYRRVQSYWRISHPFLHFVRLLSEVTIDDRPAYTAGVDFSRRVSLTGTALGQSSKSVQLLSVSATRLPEKRESHGINCSGTVSPSVPKMQAKLLSDSQKLLSEIRTVTISLLSSLLLRPSDSSYGTGSSSLPHVRKAHKIPV